MELSSDRGYLDLLQQISDTYLPEREELRRELELTLREAGAGDDDLL